MNAYPLAWPTTQARTPASRRENARFGKRDSRYVGLRNLTIGEATRELMEQLRMLGAKGVVLSTNLRVKLDGLPYSNQREPDDAGAAVYFELDKKPIVIACDKWTFVYDNIYAIAMHIDSMRGQERWGCGSRQQQFAGYAALPAGGDDKPWWQVLGMPGATVNVDEINAAWKRRIRNAHPDAGGSEAEAAAINAARDEGLREGTP